MLNKVAAHKALLVFTLLFLPLTLWLGFWQLDRVDQKRQLIASLTALEQPLVIAAGQSVSDLLDMQRVTLQASFIKPFAWFKDNQVVNGQVGYDLVALVNVGADLLLVNRGWFASHGQRDPLPTLPWLEGGMSLTGRLVPIQANPYQLAADVYTGQYPQLVQAFDLPQLQSQLKQPLLPWVLKLDAPSPALLVPHWRASTMTPEKHLGYAWQWFGLALTLCLLYIYRVFFATSD
jgi:cytochrome oxidase assembly protein ShyY1